MYLIALYKDKNGECHIENTRNNKEFSYSDSKTVESWGYKLVSCIITTDSLIYLKTRLKYRIEELKGLRPSVDYYGYDETLIRQIGLLTNRLMRRGVEITDEIALQCKDLRDSWILKERI